MLPKLVPALVRRSTRVYAEDRVIAHLSN
jgi:hypothetical protein